jgi:hypothetical protein
MKVFKIAPYDAFIKIGTWGLSLLFFVGIPGCEIIRGEEYLIVFYVTVPIGAIWLVAYLFVPRKYVVNSNRLVIKRLVCSISLPYEGIASIEIVDKVKPSIKVWANAGLFCYAGLFLVDNDVVRIYATNLKRMVRVKTTDGKTYYLSPADPEKFVAAVKEHLN